MSQFDVLQSLFALTILVLLFGEGCCKLKKRIVGGRKCRIPTEFAVAIVDKSLTIRCGGALLDHRWVVTAAQCCTPEIEYVLAGTPTISWATLEKPAKTKIRKCIPHEDYKPEGLLNNIALIFLDKAVAQSDYVKYVSLPHAQLPDDILNWYPKCSVMGWGAISFSYAGSKSKAIRCALLEVAPSKDCSKVYKGMSESIVCIHTNTSAACGVDAGGPLVCQNVLYGIASYSGACERGVPGVYARVDTYLAFIIPHILREADSNVLHQAISVIVLACVHIALFLYSVVIWFPYTRFTFDNKNMKLYMN